MPDPTTPVKDQLAALHRAVAAQRRLTFAAVMGLLASVLWNVAGNNVTPLVQAQDKPIELTCRALKVVDEEGKVRLHLSYDKTGGMLRLNNAAGKPVVAIESDADGGFVSLLGHDGKERAFVGVGDKQSGGLIYLKDTEGKTRTTYVVYKDGNGGLSFRNAGGKQEAFFGVSSKGHGGLINLNGSDAKSRVVIDIDKDGRGALELLNEQDKAEVFLGSSSKGLGGLLNLKAPNGVAGAIFDIDDKGTGRINLRTKDALRIFYSGADPEGGTCQIYGYDGKQRVFLGVGDKQSGGVFYLLNPDNNRPRVILGIDDTGAGFGEGRDANGTTRRSMR